MKRRFCGQVIFANVQLNVSQCTYKYCFIIDLAMRAHWFLRIYTVPKHESGYNNVCLLYDYAGKNASLEKLMNIMLKK